MSAALAACRGAFIASAVFSGMSNILMLTGAIFMLEIYDRVLPSHSVPTLIALIVIATALYYAALGILDLIRSRILGRVGASLDEAICDRVYDALVCLPLKAGNRGDGLQSLRQLDSAGISVGHGAECLFDLPWIPLYLAICFAFHTLIELTALVGAVILCALTILTEVYTRDSSKQSDRPWSVAKQSRGNEPAECRGACRDGNDAPPGQSMA